MDALESGCSTIKQENGLQFVDVFLYYRKATSNASLNQLYDRSRHTLTRDCACDQKTSDYKASIPL
jgi:hypothetical protein